MIPIGINTTGLSAEFALSKSDVDNLMEFTVKEISAAFAREWETNARNSLGSTRNQYINSIIVSERGRYTGVVGLNPAQWLPNAIEGGATPFDMKEGFSRSPKRKIKTSGKGWYLTVPYRWATPGAIGESEVFTGVMPTSVQKAVVRSEKLGNAALSKVDIPSEYQIPKPRQRIIHKSAAFEEYKRKTSLFTGMKRNDLGSGYTTFRRVSDKSNDDAWIHPGFNPMDLMGKSINNFMGRIPHEVDMAIDNYLGNLLGI